MTQPNLFDALSWSFVSRCVMLASKFFSKLRLGSFRYGLAKLTTQVSNMRVEYIFPKFLIYFTLNETLLPFFLW